MKTGENLTTCQPNPYANLVTVNNINLVIIVSEMTQDRIENVASGLIDTDRLLCAAAIWS